MAPSNPEQKRPLGVITVRPDGSFASAVGPFATEIFRLRTIIVALKLEAQGLRTWRNRSALSVAKITTNLTTNNRELHIKKLEAMIDERRHNVEFRTATE